MSNEELAVQIQNGAPERMGELWEQVAGLVKWKAKRIMTALELRGSMCGVDFDDLVQCGYPALVAAVDSYSPESGTFSTWFMYHLKNAFAEATGYRTQRGKNEPMNHAASLDKPLTDEENSSSLVDFVPDQKAAATMEAVEEREYQGQLHEALEMALGTLPEACSQVLRLRYYQDRTLTEVGETLGVVPERVRQMENRGLRILRQPKNAACLRPFYEFDFYCHTGMSAFLHTGMSVQERYLIVEEERRERMLRRRRQAEEEQERQWETVENQQAAWQREREALMSELSPEGLEKLCRMLTGDGKI